MTVAVAMPESRSGVVLPHAPEAEVAVLGAMLIDPDAVSRALELLSPTDFYAERHRTVFGVMSWLYHRGDTIDPVTLSEALTERGALRLVGGVDYVGYLMDAVPTGANVSYHASIVKSRALRRRLYEAGSDIATQALKHEATDLTELIDRCEETIFAVAEGTKSGSALTHVGELLHDAFELMESMQQGGVPTGLTDLDRMLSIRPGSLTIVAGRPSMGKSALVQQIALHASLRLAERLNTALFSVEMTKEENVIRLLAQESLLDLARLMRGDIHDGDSQRMMAAAGAVQRAALWIDDEATTAAEMRGRARRYAAENKLGLIVVDHVHEMQGPGEERRHQVGTICRDLKRLAKELHVPVIAAAQLSRKPEERSDHRPVMSDLFESSEIEQAADAVVLLYRPEYYEASDRPGVAEAIVAKQRNGPTGTVELVWRKECARFDSLAQQRLL